MNKVMYGLLLITLLFAGCSAPEVQFARGGGTSWEQLRGQWLVINYWAEWCAPCRKEIPELNELQAQGQDAGVTVLGVNFDGVQGERLTRLMDEMDVQFPVVLQDPAARWDQAPPTVLPSTLIVDPQGNLREVLVGPQTFEDLARAVEMTAEM